VTDAINLQLFLLARTTDQFKFVDTLKPTFLLTDISVSSTPVKPGGNGNPRPFDPLTGITDTSDDLEQGGLHLTTVGDPIFIGNRWGGGVRAMVAAKRQTQLPFPSQAAS